MAEDTDCEVLISLVENRPVLWDRTRDGFKDRIVTRNAWLERGLQELNLTDDEDFLELVELELLPRAPRNFRMRDNNLFKWNDEEFRARFRYLATGSTLQAVGDFTGIDKSTASRIIHKVVTTIARLRLPTQNDGLRDYYPICHVTTENNLNSVERLTIGPNTNWLTK
ncbi:hypothetical protein JTB14_033431 [Gonioctena quinquepunctata]|nr:hypothetical protein JTB14_033431 [Gonioctena quinquepunctata]